MKYKIFLVIILFLFLIIVKYPKGHDTLAGVTLSNEFSECPWCGWGEKMYLGHPKNYEHSPILMWIETVIEKLLGVPAGTNLLYILIFFSGFLTMYLFAKHKMKNRYAALIAGLAYTFSYYHVVEVGFEGHLHLGFTYVLLPIVIMEIEKRLDDSKIVVWNILLFSLFMLSAPQAILLIAPFLLLYIFRFINAGKKSGKVGIWIDIRIIKTIAVYTIGMVVLTSFWWIPLVLEKDYLGQTKYDINSVKGFQAEWTDAVLLRPPSSAVPTYTSYGLLNPLETILLILPTAIIVLSVLLNPKRDNLFYFLCLLLSSILSVGLNSPLYNILWDNFPFFNTIRTPARFMMFGSFAYAIITAYLVQRFKKKEIFLLLTIILVAPSIGDVFNSFTGFDLTNEQKVCFESLKMSPDGRLFAMSMDAWAYDKKIGPIPNPNYYTWLHKKDVIGGVVSSESTKWTITILNNLFWAFHNKNKLNISNFLSLTNVRYLLIDKNYGDSKYVKFDGKELFKCGNMGIYKFNPLRRLYLTKSINSNWDQMPKSIQTVDFKQINPGKYIVNADLKQEMFLVLSESYYPTWTATLDNGKEIKSSIAYGFLNSFRLPSGKYKVILEFKESFIRKITRWISTLTLIFIILALAYEYVWKRI